ncbi:MAG TPA: LLM class flavin-dependent oxidoreductase [Chloroflexota bacterium]|nr:LLM class flavin-dependent oxidoreductase [Chloroflexota bacterium]
MRVFIFDLLPYSEHLDHLKPAGETELPWPLPRRHFKPEVAVRTYAEHLEAWGLMDRLGFDGIGFNEHHTSPYGLMNSPNLLASAVSQRTKQIKILIYGNLTPLHDPLRLAEELAMVDCLSNGRLISGFARGIPREYKVYNVPLTESRARFEEAWEIIRRAWTEEVFDFDGRFWSYRDVAIWPRPVQQPHPPVWVPVSGSKETIEWAARFNIPITPGLGGHPGVREDITRYYGRCLAENGFQLTPDHLVIQHNVYIAESKAQAVRECGPYTLYFNQTLFSHGNFTASRLQKEAGYLTSSSFDYVRPENLEGVAWEREQFRSMTMEKLERQAETMPWGTAEEVRQRLIADADRAGANTLLLGMNRGAMPHELFMNQIRRFAAEVLPALQAHEVKPRPVESLSC